MSKPSVLLIGAGFIGGTILDRLLKQSYPVSVVYRRDDTLPDLKSLGVTPIKASLDDAEDIEEAVFKHEVLINTASSDHPGSVEASLNGIERRAKQGLKTVYIHTSGTALLADLASGAYLSDQVWYDDDPASIEALPAKAPHRFIDKNLVQRADKWKGSGLVQLRIILPPLIWGQGCGPFKAHSFQIPAVVKASVDAKAAVVHGPGKAVWSQINVQDVADGYVVLLDALLKGTLPLQSRWDYYVFAENGEVAWIDIARSIQTALEAKGVIAKGAKIKHLSDDEAFQHGLVVPKGAPGWDLDQDIQIAGSNSRSRSIKLKQLGWHPRNSSHEDLLASIAADVEVILKQFTPST